MAKRMGTNPLSGLNGLIRSTQEARHTQDAQDAHDVQDTHDVQGAREVYGAKIEGRAGKKLPRINMAFSEGNLEYLRAISGFERVSATQYVNDLIRADMESRRELYERLCAMREGGGKG